MMNLVFRIYQRITHLLFFAFYKSSFEALSWSVRFVGPFRLDGTDGINIQDGTFFQRGVWLYCCGIDGIKAKLSIGKNCVFGHNNHITCVRKVTIGDFVLTANGVYISDNLHGYEDTAKPIIQQSVIFKRNVNIGDGSWIGENVSIIGASVGKNSVIGANSVVTRDIPDYCVAVGAPAVVIRQFDFQLQVWVDKKQIVLSGNGAGK
jgi:acetyltransferase-like isoleucine patch superfamily enzyme